MVEHRNFYSDVEGASIPDRIYPDESGVILGLVVGKETIRQIRVPNITGTKEFVTSVIKRPVVAVMRDSNGNNYCEPYDTSLHGEERELEHIPADELLHNEDFFDVWECVEEALAE